MTAMAARLARVVPPGARFATERDFPDEIVRTGVSHPDLWLAARSGRNTLNIFNLESSPAPRAGYQAEHIDPAQPALIARALSRVGVTHVVTVKPATADALQGLTAGDYFEHLATYGPLSLFRLRPVEGWPDPATLMSTGLPGSLQSRLIVAQPEHLAWRVRGSGPVTIAVGWSPKWTATLAGHRVELRRTFDGLLEASVPRSGRLDLRYRRDRWDALGALVSALAFAGLVLVGLGSRLPRRPRH